MREVELGLPPDALCNYGTSLAGLPQRSSVLFTFVDPPAASRLVLFDLRSAKGSVVGNVRGELRGAVLDGDRVHALLTYGLYELSLDPFAVTRSLHARLPDYANALWPGPRPRTLVVHRVTNKRAPVVDIATYELSGTVPTSSLPSPEVGLTIVLHTHGPMPKKLPTRPARTRVLGKDAKGRDVVTRGQTVILVDAGGKEVARFDAGVPLAGATLAGPSTVAAFPKKQATLRSLVLVEWGDDAKRAITKTTPLPSRRKPKVETSEIGRTRHAQALFSNVLVREGAIGGHDFHRCRFDGLNLNAVKGRIVVRDATLDRCTFAGSFSKRVAFADCTLLAPKVVGANTFYSCVFKHVRVTGDLGGRLRVYESFGDEDARERERARQEAAEYYRDVDWALDLREADVSGIRLEGVPPALVRRDPKTLLLLWTKDAQHSVWQSKQVNGWRPYALDRAVKYGQASAFVGLSRRSEPAVIAALREAGVVDDVTGTR